MRSAAGALATGVKLSGALLLGFLMFKIPLMGVYKLTGGTFAVFKVLAVVFAVCAFVNSTRDPGKS